MSPWGPEAVVAERRLSANCGHWPLHLDLATNSHKTPFKLVNLLPFT